MNLHMVDYTGLGHPSGAERHAMNVLMFSKDTRLMRAPDMLEIDNMSEDERREKVRAIARTIPSSWEFVHYTVLVEGATRAFTHQLVRSRHLSFAQQTMRMLEMDKFEYGEPQGCDKGAIGQYRYAMYSISRDYRDLLRAGMKPEDARGILPTNICTNILVGGNLRSFVELVRKRSSPRVQGEYRQFIEQLQKEIEWVHPFTAEFFSMDRTAINKELEAELAGIEDGRRTRILKLVHELQEGA